MTLMKMRNDSLLDRFFEDFDSLWGFPKLHRDEFNLPKADVREFDNKYLIDMEVPGAKEDDISIELVNNQLTVRAERGKENHQDNGKYKLSEISKGVVSRSFNISGVDEENIEAWLDSGVLHISAPKSESYKRKQIKVKSLESDTS